MAEPAWKIPAWEPEREASEEAEERSTLQRWVETPEGEMELLELPGIPEYLIVDATPRRGVRRYSLLGYRLDSRGRYQPIQPDSEGGLLSKTTGIRFLVGPTGDRVLLFDAATGRQLLNLVEQEERAQTAEERAEVAEERALRESQQAIREVEARRSAEEKARHEEDARRAAESEVARLRAEIERLRQGSD